MTQRHPYHARLLPVPLQSPTCSRAASVERNWVDSRELMALRMATTEGALPVPMARRPALSSTKKASSTMLLVTLPSDASSRRMAWGKGVGVVGRRELVVSGEHAGALILHGK